jgi:hypothetical protein
MLSSYQDLIEGLTETPGALRDLLGTPVPDDLDPAQVALLAELRARERAQLGRVQRVMREQQTYLRAIEREPEVVEVTAGDGLAAGAGQSPEALLTAFNDGRSELIALLMNLTLRDWERPVNHEQAGEVTLSEEIDAHLTWDEEMLGRIRGGLRTED